MSLPLRPVQGLNDPNQQRRDRETLNDILTFRHDDSRIRTPAEISAGVTPVNYAYSPGPPHYDVRRLGAVQDGTDQTSLVNQAILAVAGSQTLGVSGGVVYVPQGVGVTLTNLVLKKNVTVVIDGNGVQTKLTTGYFAGGSGAVNEHWFSAPLHPAIILDAHDDLTGPALGAGQVLSYRASYLWAANGTTYWQFAQDIDALKAKGLCLYANSPSRQFLFFDHVSNIRYGQRESTQDFTTPKYPHTFCHGIGIIDDVGGANNPYVKLAILQSGVKEDTATVAHQKRIEIDSSGVINFYADDDSTLIARLDDLGHFRTLRGVSGNSWTTAQRNAFTGLTGADQGLMVYDNVLNKPIWLKSVGPLVWVDATGTAV